MKWLKRSVLALVILLVVAQVVRPAKSNPPIDPAKELRAPQPVASILQRSCVDCHSNRTVWPWYSNVAPVSWLLARDVKDGRKEVNFSDWTSLTPRREARRLQAICDEVKGHDMPLWFYVPLHPAAKLSDADRGAICNWATAQRAKVIAAHPEAAAPAPAGSAGRPRT